MVGWSKDPDIALIELNEPAPETLEWAPSRDLEEGEQIVAMGYPVPANDFSVIGGAITSFQVAGGVKEAFRTDAALDFGNSGGPAVTPFGKVAGVVTAVQYGGLQFVPLVFTYDALESTIAALESGPAPWLDCSDLPGG